MMVGGGGARGKGPTGNNPAGGGKSSIPFVTERDFEQHVVQSDVPVIIEFTSERSQQCKQVAPEVEAFARETEGKAKVVRVDVDKAPVLARELRVQQVPTFMLFAEQKIVDGVVGVVSKKKLLEMVDPYLPRAAGAIKSAELAQVLREGGVVPVDTRDANAFGRAHIPGAINMPIETIEERLAELHMLAGQPVLYCRSGDKTKDVAERLNEQGVPVAFLEGGFLAWEADGLPIERP